MNVGHFYFLDDKYFSDYPDPLLMGNHATVSGQAHDRPCFYAFQDSKTGLYWLIPCSSQVQKYKSYYNKRIAKHGKCDTLVFGGILGSEKVFLIQNMCPADDTYIKNEYIDKISSLPVRVDGVLEKEVIKKAKKVLALQRKGIKLIYPNVLDIEKQLLSK